MIRRLTGNGVEGDVALEMSLLLGCVLVVLVQDGELR